MTTEGERREPNVRARMQIVQDNLRLLDRNLRLECELAELKARQGRVVRITDNLRRSAAGIYAAYGDGPVPRDLAKLASEYHGISEQLEEALGIRRPSKRG